MQRPRVLLFEDDPVLMSVLLELLSDEDIDVTRCESLEEIQVAVGEHPGAVVVSDFWSETSSVKLGEPERAEIQALGKTASVILTTARWWGARLGDESQFGETVLVIPKPYDLDQLLAAIRIASASDARPTRSTESARAELAFDSQGLATPRGVLCASGEAVNGGDKRERSNTTIELNFTLKRNIGTVGRPRVACAVCNFSPSGHVLSALPRLEAVPEPDKGLCNVHARGLAQNEAVSNGKLDEMRQEWLASR
jgi:CheY-like chemotaxis protein